MSWVRAEEAARKSGSVVLLGLGTQVSNPKTAIVYATVFAAFLPSSYSWSLALATLCSVFIIEAGWYSIVALTLASTKPRKVYLSYKAWIDRFSGIVIGALGIKLITSLRTSTT